MAVIANQRVSVLGQSVFKWETLTATDTGEPVSIQDGGVITVQVLGTFGGTVTFEGTIDGVTWFTLRDTAGNDVSFTAAGYSEISTAIVAIRPAAGSGVSDVDAFMNLAA